MSEVDTSLKIIGSKHFNDLTRAQKDFFREKFLEFKDPTGYFFAEAWLNDGYRKWPSFIKSYGTVAEIKEWQETLSVRLQAEGILKIASQKDSFQAAKWLADKGWAEKHDKRTKEAKKQAERAHEEVQEDMARLGLKLVKTK